ncbi:hypothetical protein DEU56DRAFT_751560 [Suillus clintonianus]|uniref:uncharacterized protein n=1 Tax=Suillus clintonianus TaxID=1904413 RepID=UPI001B871374|nr:uncharacterized protein DEU56DRAFT_751560 [Suillus clintonianus]KAG2153863.1 hypothetical protein DEU56DRAFT_751560 [Suillus clintonianus]
MSTEGSVLRDHKMQLHRSMQGCQRPAKQSKIASQRQYRVNEGDGFQELRDIIRLVTGEAPQTRRETLKKGAELLRQFSTEKGSISRHEPLPPLENPLATPYCEVDQESHISYEPLVIPNNETWTVAIAPWTRNSNPMPDTFETTPMLYNSHPQEEIHHVVSREGDWNFVRPTPPQFRQYSLSAQWNYLSPIHLNVDQVASSVEGVGVI